MRNSLRKEDKVRVFYGIMGDVNYDGRRTLFDVVMLDEAGNHIVKNSYMNHINTSQRAFRKQEVVKSKYVRFTGKPYKYMRFNKTHDYSVEPRKATPMSIEQIAQYDKFLLENIHASSETLMWRRKRKEEKLKQK